MGRLRLQYLRTKLGMSLPDKPQSIILTPLAAEKFREILSEAGTESACVALGVPEPGESNFTLKVAPAADAQSETVVEVSGIRIAVPKNHVDRAAGVVIDFQKAPKNGFAIARLYAPSESR